MRRLSNNKGFSLLEVLVAVVILAVGLLAAASMQTMALTSTTASRNTTLAVQLAEEMVDRIRVNAGSTSGTLLSYNNLNTSNCTGLVDPALGDCTQWQSRLQSSGLPSAAGTVTVTLDSDLCAFSDWGTVTTTANVTWGVTGVKRMKVISTMLAKGC